MTAESRTKVYKRWQQRTRQRALRRLEAAHPDQYRQLLTEEQTANPYRSEQ